MGNDELRTVLEGVARGEVTADEAERLLGGVDDDPDEVQNGEPSSWSRARGLGDAPVVRAVLNGGGLVEVAGEDVDAPRLEGPHNCQVVEHGDGSIIVSGQFGHDALLVVPADADLEIQINAAEASITGIEGTLRAVLNVGPVEVSGRLWRGRSSVRANAGNVDIVLDPASDVTVAVRCVAAAVNAGAAFRKTARGEWTLGDGTAELEITGNLGTIDLSVR